MRSLVVRDAGGFSYFDIDETRITFNNLGLDEPNENGEYELWIEIFQMKSNKKYRIPALVNTNKNEFLKDVYKLVQEFVTCSLNGEVIITTPAFCAWEQWLWREHYTINQMQIANSNKDNLLIKDTK